MFGKFGKTKSKKGGKVCPKLKFLRLGSSFETHLFGGYVFGGGLNNWVCFDYFSPESKTNHWFLYEMHQWGEIG